MAGIVSRSQLKMGETTSFTNIPLLNDKYQRIYVIDDMITIKLRNILASQGWRFGTMFQFNGLWISTYVKEKRTGCDVPPQDAGDEAREEDVLREPDGVHRGPCVRWEPLA